MTPQQFTEDELAFAHRLGDAHREEAVRSNHGLWQRLAAREYLAIAAEAVRAPLPKEEPAPSPAGVAEYERLLRMANTTFPRTTRTHLVAVLNEQHAEMNAIHKALVPECPVHLGQPNHCDVSLCDCGGALGMEVQVTALLEDRDRWRALADAYDWDRQTLARDVDRLLRFAGTVIREHRNDGFPGDVDGGVLQDALVDAGLLAPVSVDQPCGDNCVCADYGDFPMTCLRLTALGEQVEARASQARPPGRAHPARERGKQMCAMSVLIAYVQERVSQERWTAETFAHFRQVLDEVEALDAQLAESACVAPDKAAWLAEMEKRFTQLEGSSEPTPTGDADEAHRQS